LRAKEADVAASERKLLSAESQVNELQARLNDAVNQRRHWEDEYNVSSFFFFITTLALCCMYSGV